MDGDLQHKPSDIKKILYKFFRGNHFVIGTRDKFKKKKHNLNFFKAFRIKDVILLVNLLLGKKPQTQ